MNQIKQMKLTAVTLLAFISVNSTSMGQVKTNSQNAAKTAVGNIHYRHTDVNGQTIFYREAGQPGAPVILLLHGYPTSSHMFRNLIPMLSGKYHVIAPDLPGFGYSDMPDRTKYAYTFDNLAKTMQSFIDQIGLKRFAIYVFDYGAPVGFRLAVANPEKITGIISQNGNAYEEGLSKIWDQFKNIGSMTHPKTEMLLKIFILLKVLNFSILQEFQTHR